MSDPSGFLLIDKPAGMTSFDIVRKLRGLLGIRKLGHSGVLDRPAMGLLVMGAGQATRLFELFGALDKEYEADIWLGLRTTTDDLAGELLEPQPAATDPNRLTAQEVTAALQQQVGEIDQLPPAFSLTKIDGKEMYRYALAGQTPEARPKRVRIEALEVTSDGPGSPLTAADLPPDSKLALAEMTGPLRRVGIRLLCRGGVYVRSIARDLGSALGCGGAVGRLVRTRVGPFRLEDAWTLAELEADPPALADILLPLSTVATESALLLTPAEITLVTAGKTIRRPVEQLPPLAPPGLLFGLEQRRDAALELVALLAVQERAGVAELRPKKVFASTAPAHASLAEGR